MLVNEIHTENCGWIQKGKYERRRTHYRSALLQLLRKIHPVNCLEIGTHRAESTAVFQKYFDEQCPDGHLVTCDIRDYVNDYSRWKNVEFRKVYAHTEDVFKWHQVDDKQMLPNWRDVDSVKENIEILKRDVPYDFIFIDGDHTKHSLLCDLQVAESLGVWPHYIFIDNINDEAHDSVKVFWDELYTDPTWNCYTFNNWACNADSAVDFALIWRK